jgi:hypothetical protein
MAGAYLHRGDPLAATATTGARHRSARKGDQRNQTEVPTATVTDGDQENQTEVLTATVTDGDQENPKDAPKHSTGATLENPQVSPKEPEGFPAT